MKEVILEYELDELVQMSPDFEDTVSLAISEKIEEYCKKHGININDIDYESDFGTVKIKIRMFDESGRHIKENKNV